MIIFCSTILNRMVLREFQTDYHLDIVTVHLSIVLLKQYTISMSSVKICTTYWQWHKHCVKANMNFPDRLFYVKTSAFTWINKSPYLTKTRQLFRPHCSFQLLLKIPMSTKYNAIKKKAKNQKLNWKFLRNIKKHGEMKTNRLRYNNDAYCFYFIPFS